MEKTIPLLHDNHNHVSLYASLANVPDISTMNNKEAYSFLEKLPSDKLSVVRGWKTNDLPLNKGELKTLPPVLLINFSLHGFAVTNMAVPYMISLVPKLAEKKDDKKWCESNVPAIFDAYCKLSGLDNKKLEQYIDGLLPLGIGSSCDMVVPNKEALNVCCNISCPSRIENWVSPEVFGTLNQNEKDHVCGLKLFIDGAIGARSAAIKGPYVGEGKAMFTYSDDELLEKLKLCQSLCKKLSIHAIGEEAVEQTLNCLERAFGKIHSFKLIRLEHVQMISEIQAKRAKEMGIVLSMQANFSSDSRDYTDRLTPEYLQRNNPFRMLIDKIGFVPGVDMIFGSDGMPDGIAYAATEALFPVYPSQYLSLDELVSGYGLARGISGSTVLEINEKTKKVIVLESKVTGKE